jgi:hypothetical protein
LDARIEHMRATLTQLVQKRKETQISVRLCKVLTSPIRRLPSDIISEIISMASSSIRRFDGTTVNRSPWSLALVSRFWRHSALAYHHLWRYIEIAYSKRRSLDEMNLQLTCAGYARADSRSRRLM